MNEKRYMAAMAEAMALKFPTKGTWASRAQLLVLDLFASETLEELDAAYNGWRLTATPDEVEELGDIAEALYRQMEAAIIYS